MLMMAQTLFRAQDSLIPKDQLRPGTQNSYVDDLENCLRISVNLCFKARPLKHIFT